jgi:hypothetical protein
MSFTADEVTKLKALVAPKGKAFKYSHGAQSCEVERELTPAELNDWERRIDELGDL